MSDWLKGTTGEVYIRAMIDEFKNSGTDTYVYMPREISRSIFRHYFLTHKKKLMKDEKKEFKSLKKNLVIRSMKLAKKALEDYAKKLEKDDESILFFVIPFAFDMDDMRRFEAGDFTSMKHAKDTNHWQGTIIDVSSDKMIYHLDSLKLVHGKQKTITLMEYYEKHMPHRVCEICVNGLTYTCDREIFDNEAKLAKKDGRESKVKLLSVFLGRNVAGNYMKWTKKEILAMYNNENVLVKVMVCPWSNAILDWIDGKMSKSIFMNPIKNMKKKIKSNTMVDEDEEEVEGEDSKKESQFEEEAFRIQGYTEEKQTDSLCGYYWLKAFELFFEEGLSPTEIFVHKDFNDDYIRNTFMRKVNTYAERRESIVYKNKEE